MLDVPHETTKPAGVFRVAVIGDSISFGLHVQYDDAWPKRLERMLNNNAGGRKVEVMNFAQPGLSTFQEVDDLREAFGHDPDLVILGFCLNDPEFKLERTTGMVRRPGEGRWADIQRLSRLELKVSRVWRTFGFVARRIRNRLSRSAFIRYHRGLFDEGYRGWRMCRDSLEVMARECRERRVPLAVAVFPLLGLPLTKKGYPFRDQHAKVAGVLAAAGVPRLDLYETFRGIPGDRLEVIPGIDRHFSEIGHRLAAEAIHRFLLEEGLVPADLAMPRVTDMRVMEEYRPTYRRPDKAD
jgi:hypothetical protein